MKTENIQDIYEVSPVQQGLLFHSLYASELALYLTQLGFIMRGALDVVAFERAWQQVVARHTVLRTSFYWEEIDKPLQVVYRNVKVPLEQQDWRGIEPVEQHERLNSFLKCDRNRGFDLSQVPLIRLTLIQLDNHSYQFLLSAHMIILDGWSLPLIIQEAIELYATFCQGQDTPLVPGSTFRDYIAWLRKQDSSKAEEFWRQMLKGVKAPTPISNLNVDNLSSPEEKFDESQIKLSKASTTKLQSLARQHHLTINVLLQGVWALLLSRYSCKNEVVYGCTVSGRPVDLEGSESMVGWLVNTLPVRVKVDAEQYLMPWFKQLQEQLVEIRQYEYSALVDIQRWSEVPQGMPLFESIFVFENQPMDTLLQESQNRNLSINFTDVINLYKTNYPLTVVGYPGLELLIGISYDYRRFDTATITSILRHFKILLEGIVTHPEVQLKELSLLTEPERQITFMLEKQVSFNFDLLPSP
jgi:hypothetical protein